LRAARIGELERAAAESQGKGDDAAAECSQADYERARSSSSGDKTVYVRSYVRKDGTHVSSYTRSTPHR